jgi:hypothetical protein
MWIPLLVDFMRNILSFGVRVCGSANAGRFTQLYAAFAIPGWSAR